MLYQFTNNPPIKISGSKENENVIVTINYGKKPDTQKITLNSQIESGKLKIPVSLYIGDDVYSEELIVEVYLQDKKNRKDNGTINFRMLVVLYHSEDKREAFLTNHIEGVIGVV